MPGLSEVYIRPQGDLRLAATLACFAFVIRRDSKARPAVELLTKKYGSADLFPASADSFDSLNLSIYLDSLHCRHRQWPSATERP